MSSSEQTPKKARQTTVSDSEETDPGYRSRSQSRRARRKKQTQSQKQQQSMPSVPESSSEPQATPQQAASAQSSAETQRSLPPQQAQQQDDGMQPFEWIGPDSTSMDGPVTHARAMRGEIPVRPGNPKQKLETAGGKGESKMMDQDGLKLRLELNLDIEIELKAKIYGDLTLALLA